MDAATAEKGLWDDADVISVYTRAQAIEDGVRDVCAENDKLREALQSLYDEQNGPPLIRHAKEWEAAMDKARATLKETQ